MDEDIFDSSDKLGVLIRAGKRRLPARISEGDSELYICAELIDSGYLDGWVTLDRYGEPTAVLDARITPLGVEYLEQFEESSFSQPSAFSRINLDQLHPRQWLRGVGAFVVLVTILFFVGKSKDNFANANENGLGSAPAQPTTLSAKISFGVCGMPPVD